MEEDYVNAQVLAGKAVGYPQSTYTYKKEDHSKIQKKDFTIVFTTDQEKDTINLTVSHKVKNSESEHSTNNCIDVTIGSEKAQTSITSNNDSETALTTLTFAAEDAENMADYLMEVARLISEKFVWPLSRTKDLSTPYIH